MGIKDHMVLPMEKLKNALAGELSSREWPYSYHQRLFAHPDVNGNTVDQLALAVERIAKTPHSRRAVATTAVPNIDPFLQEDIPCLREIQLRCPEDAQGNLVLHMNTVWRSRDLYKAWPDNIVGLTFLQRTLAERIEALAQRPVLVGSYADYSSSLHIYGQGFGAVGGDKERGLQSFFDTFDEEAYVAASFSSEIARDMLILPQLHALISESGIRDWHFPPEAIELGRQLIEDMESGKFTP